MDLNRDGAFNVHNIANFSFRNLLNFGTLFLCVTTVVFLFCRKNRIIDVPLPSIPLTFCFAATMFYMESALGFSGFGFLRIWKILLLVIVIVHALLSIHALLSRNDGLLSMAVATAMLVSVAVYVHHRFHVVHVDIAVAKNPSEARENLIGRACLLYALEVLSSRRRSAARPFAGSGSPGGWSAFAPSRTTMSALAVAGAVALAFFGSRAAARVATQARGL